MLIGAIIRLVMRLVRKNKNSGDASGSPRVGQ